VQELTANVEEAYKALQRSRTALSALITAGQATCNDIKTFNGVVKSTYFYQKAIAGIVRATGEWTLEIPDPIYVSYKGKTGDAAVNMDCGIAQLQGWRPTGLGDFYVNPAHVEWRTGATPSDLAGVQAVIAKAKASNPPTGQLGLAPLALLAGKIILYSIIFAVAGYTIVKIIDAFGDIVGRKHQARITAIAAAQHAATLEARAKCLADCTKAGKPYLECAKACARLNPEFKTPADEGFLSGILGKVVMGAVVLGVIFVGYKVVMSQLETGGGGTAGADDDDGDSFEDMGVGNSKHFLPPGRLIDV
jgi:hypothetical protein